MKICLLLAWLTVTKIGLCQNIVVGAGLHRVRDDFPCPSFIIANTGYSWDQFMLLGRFQSLMDKKEFRYQQLGLEGRFLLYPSKNSWNLFLDVNCAFNVASNRTGQNAEYTPSEIPYLFNKAEWDASIGFGANFTWKNFQPYLIVGAGERSMSFYYENQNSKIIEHYTDGGFTIDIGLNYLISVKRKHSK